MAGCDSCPDYIISAVARPVEAALTQVRSVKKVVEKFNALVRHMRSDVLAQLVDDIRSIADQLPPAPVLNLGDIIGILTCPLTPFALMVDPTYLAKLDPARVVEMIKQSMQSYLNEIVRTWVNGLRSLPTWPSIKPFFDFFNALRRVNLNTLLLAEATALSLAVRGLCRDVYEEGPFSDFDEAMSGFSVAGVVPSNVADDAKSVLTEVQVGELKIQAWRLFVAQ
jgi:hypothetical protein